MCLAIPGRVESLHDHDGIRMGMCNFGGVIKEVCLEYLPEVQIGDYAIVHVGFAISRVDEEAAEACLAEFSRIAELGDEASE